MQFDDPKVAAVFRRYLERAASDRQTMRDLGPAGMARRDEFLLPIGTDVGALLHALILAKRPRRILELGTSYGYSTLILADAARSVGAQLISMDLADYKQAFARDQLAEAGLDSFVELRCGDAVQLIAADAAPFDFVLLDIWKNLYIACLDAFLPKLAEGGIIAADNMLQPESGQPAALAYRAAVGQFPELQSLLLDVGSGIELSIKWRAGAPI